MTNAGYHAADDGSLARSTGGAAARGAMLIALALAIGLLLMTFALDDPSTEITATNGTDQDDGTVTDDGTDATDDDGTEDDPGVAVGVPGDSDDDTPPATIDDGDDGTTTPTIAEAVDDVANDPAEVNILVANGTGQKGIAGTISDKLKAKGYIANAANAPSTAEAVIYYRVGYAADARLVAEILGAGPDVIIQAPGDGTIAVAQEAKDDGRLVAANVVVIIGADNNIPTS